MHCHMRSRERGNHAEFGVITHDAVIVAVQQLITHVIAVIAVQQRSCPCLTHTSAFAAAGYQGGRHPFNLPPPEALWSDDEDGEGGQGALESPSYSTNRGLQRRYESTVLKDTV